MAEKCAVLMKHEYYDYAEKAKLSDADFGLLMKGIFEYDKTGTEPEYENPVLTALFGVIQIDLDKNKKKWEETVKERSEAGKRGGAPVGNFNASKQPETSKNNQKQAKQAKQADLDLDSDYEFEEEESFSSAFSPSENPKEAGEPPKSADPPEKDEIPPDKPADKPIEREEDAAALFQKARNFWNETRLKPECRNIIMRNSDVSEILQTFRFYSWGEIKNAIGNYKWHRTRAGPDFEPPVGYGSLEGFLKKGVAKYFDDNALDQQFKRGGRK